MDSISTTVWQRKGSCVVFDQYSLGEFIAEGAIVSLREVLGWKNNIPTDPPVPGKTILITAWKQSSKPCHGMKQRNS